MPRPRRDGTKAAAPRKHALSDLYIKKLKPQPRAFVIWDSKQRGLAVVVQLTGHKSWKCIYSLRGRPRWYHIGAVDAIYLADARRLASRIMFQVAEGKDPAAEKRAERGKGTFEELATRYVEEHAKRRNRSWKQADKLGSQAPSAALGQVAGRRYRAQRREGDDGAHRSANSCQPNARGGIRDIRVGHSRGNR